MFTLVSVLLFLQSHNLLKASNKLNFNSIISFISNYTRAGFLFRILLAQLSGVAPAFLFYLKFNLVITALENTHIIASLLIIINLLLATFFYLSLLVRTEVRLTKKIHNTCCQHKKFNNLKSNNNVYWSTYFCVFTLLLSFAGLFFLPCFFIILECFFGI